MEELRVSTITAILRLSTDINLKKIYNDIPITSYIPFIEYGETNETKGFSKKLLKKKRKKKQRRIFYNQATLHVFHENKIMNVKLFNNGNIQITGLKHEEQHTHLVTDLIDYLQDIDIMDEDTEIIESRLVLINSDFDLGFEINRDSLHREIIDYGMYSSYEPCIYPGVNIKYYINTNNKNGICCCEEICSGKGRADGDGHCKKITIAVFKSGKVIITGGQSKEQLRTAHKFITTFIDERKEFFSLNKC